MKQLPSIFDTSEIRSCEPDQWLLAINICMQSCLLALWDTFQLPVPLKWTNKWRGREKHGRMAQQIHSGDAVDREAHNCQVGLTGCWTASRSLHRLSPWTCYLDTGSTCFWTTTGIQDKEQFIFWVGPPQITSMVHASVGGHIGTRGPLIQAVLKPEVHLDVLGPAAFEEGSVDVYDPCYHWRPCLCLGFELLPEAMLCLWSYCGQRFCLCAWPILLKRARQMSIVCALTQNQVDVHWLCNRPGPCWWEFCHLRPYGWRRSILSLKTLFKSLVHVPNNCKGKKNYFAVVLRIGINVHKGSYSVISFLCWFFAWFRYQDDCDLTKLIQQFSFCFYLVR